jgi:hypothetical protein
MSFFNNTHGGVYEYREYGKVGFYTFPAGASANFDGIKLDISGIKVACYAGKFDRKSIVYFAKAVSRLPSAAGVINSELFINDSAISGDGWPGRVAAERYGIPDQDAFFSLQERVRSLADDHPDVLEHLRIVLSLRQWAKDEQKKIRDKLNFFVKQNAVFPKKISLLYDDREVGHTTHIVLTYQSEGECTLQIDNTLSTVPMLERTLIDGAKRDHQIDIEEVHESFSPMKPNFIKFHSKERPIVGDIELEMSRPIAEFFLRNAYNRMIFMLSKKLDLPMRRVAIRSSPYNQKNTNECVPFSIQNKIDFIEQSEPITSESLMERAIRFRAEQAIISYLLNGGSKIPHFDEMTSTKLGFSYPEDEWYPNYAKVCEELNQRFGHLSQEALEKLMLSLEIDDKSVPLSPLFKKLLLEILKAKIDPSAYEIISTPSLSDDRALELERALLPSVVYNSIAHVFFIKKATYGQMDKTKLSEYLELTTGMTVS